MTAPEQPQGAALRISIRPSGGALLLKARALGGKEFKQLVQPGDVENTRAELAEDLLTVRQHWADTLEDKPPWEIVNEALAVLRRSSRTMQSALLPNPEKWREFADVCRGALSLHRPSGGRYPLVEISAAAVHLVPLEFMLVGVGTAKPVADEVALLRACEDFLGFTAIIRRTPRDAVPDEGLAPDRRLAGGPLPVALFADADEPSAHLLAAQLRALSGNVVLDGPWPDVTKTPDVTRRVAQRVYDPRTRFAAAERGAPDQIQHFACHCETKGAPRKWKLILRGPGGEGVPVTLKDLGANLNEAGDVAGRPRRSFTRPLVFLNGCGTAEIAPFSSASFCRLFLENGNRAFIGAEATLPKAVAEAFAATFYRHLFAGHPAGLALLKAKRWLVLRHRNVLGCLYSLHGEAELHLVPPLSGPAQRAGSTQSASP